MLSGFTRGGVQVLLRSFDFDSTPDSALSDTCGLLRSA